MNLLLWYCWCGLVDACVKLNWVAHYPTDSQQRQRQCFVSLSKVCETTLQRMKVFAIMMSMTELFQGDSQRWYTFVAHVRRCSCSPHSLWISFRWGKSSFMANHVTIFLSSSTVDFCQFYHQVISTLFWQCCFMLSIRTTTWQQCRTHPHASDARHNNKKMFWWMRI